MKTDLTDRRSTASLLRTLVGPDDRRNPCVLLLLCQGGEPVQPCIVDDVRDLDPNELRRYVEPFAVAVTAIPEPGMLVAVSRPGSLAVRASDRRWCDAVHAVCEQRGVCVHGVWLTTPEGERPLPPESPGSGDGRSG